MPKAVGTNHRALPVSGRLRPGPHCLAFHPSHRAGRSQCDTRTILHRSGSFARFSLAHDLGYPIPNLNARGLHQ